jgi:hypothetical protein
VIVIAKAAAVDQACSKGFLSERVGEKEINRFVSMNEVMTQRIAIN